MRFIVTVKTNDVSYVLSKEDVDRSIETGAPNADIIWKEYLYDEACDICGIRGAADRGHGYGFDDGHIEFELHPGETFTFQHGYTDIEGPSEWNEDSYTVTVEMVSCDE